MQLRCSLYIEKIFTTFLEKKKKIELMFTAIPRTAWLWFPVSFQWLMRKIFNSRKRQAKEPS